MNIGSIKESIRYVAIILIFQLFTNLPNRIRILPNAPIIEFGFEFISNPVRIRFVNLQKTERLK
jgi:hypothetical protein